MRLTEMSAKKLFWRYLRNEPYNDSVAGTAKFRKIDIEPVTMWFGLRWQTFMAFLAAAMGKEAALGVLAALFNSQGQTAGIWDVISKQAAVSTSGLGNAMLTGISKAEALAFIYAFFFNVPCLMALATILQETHSIKWTLRIAGYYMGGALLLSAIAYHVGLLIF